MFRNITNKYRAILVGVFILVAYGVLASYMTSSKIIVMLADVISGLAVIGIAVLMFPLFKHLDKSLSQGYLILKYAEGILMVLGGLLFLIDSTQYLRDIIYDSVHIYVFIVSGFMFYILLYRSKLVPRFISIWGAAGLIAILASTLLNLVNVHYAVLDYFLILIITNEVFLAIWLMVKGFNKSVIDEYRIH